MFFMHVRNVGCMRLGPGPLWVRFQPAPHAVIGSIAGD